jgi:hypothetical protein
MRALNAGGVHGTQPRNAHKKAGTEPGFFASMM